MWRTNVLSAQKLPGAGRRYGGYVKVCAACTNFRRSHRGGAERAEFSVLIKKHSDLCELCVIPAWSAGIQIDMDVSGGILANLMDAGYPCRHDEDLYFHVL